MDSWMRNIVIQKGTNKVDLTRISGWSGTKSRTVPVIGCGMVPDWQDQRAGYKL